MRPHICKQTLIRDLHALRQREELIINNLEAINRETENNADRLERMADAVGKKSCANPKGKKTPHDAAVKNALRKAAKELRSSLWEDPNPRFNDDIPF